MYLIHILLLMCVYRIECNLEIVEDIKCIQNCPHHHHSRQQQSEQIVSSTKTIVFGPGLQSEFNVPARYFFIQAVDDQGNNFTSSPPGTFKVKITQLDQGNHVWSQILNRNDGSFIVRFRLFQPIFGLQINITYNDLSVANSPYIIRGLQYHENCYCPRLLPEWLSTMSCPNNYTQIEKDLSIFTKVDMKDVLNEAKDRFSIPGAYSFCHYTILQNKVYKKCYGQYVGFSMFMDEILLSLTRKVILPDTEFISNLGDWPLENKALHENPIPIFSWCGSKATRDIVMPTYDITESSLEMMGRVMLDILSVQGNSILTWPNKEEKAFWRGRDSRMERLDLVAMSRQYPELINASLTNFFFFQEKEKDYGPKTDHISFFDFFKFKYQINIDGTVAAYRFPYLLAGDGLVLKQDSDYYEHFYSELSPMIHYVPIKRDLSDLIQKIEWAKNNDEKAKEIAKNARQFVMENLLPQNVFCYYAQLLKEYSNKLLNPVAIHEEMEVVNQPIASSDCNCLSSETTGRQWPDEL